MVTNGTMNAQIAAVLWTIAAEKRSFVTAAVPQNAGKSAVLFAMLEHAPKGAPIHALDGTIEEIREFANPPDHGYLEVGEISDQTPSRYIWKEPVRALFETLGAGYSLATTMHADGVDDLFRQLCVENMVSDAGASIIQYVVHIHRFGEDKPDYWRRISGLYEIRGVSGGVPDVSQLFAWRGHEDDFVVVNQPGLLSTPRSVIADRAKSIARSAAKIRAAVDS